MPYTCPQCNHHPIQDECPKCGWKEQLITPKDIRQTAPPPSYPMATLEATDFEMGSAASEAGRDPDEDLHRVTLTYS
ncbi:MAG: hypothetical protein VX278_23200, partial [Myxococcota bacterium]|nr:hypothetical protein [Myxococcota bacterium]